MEFLSPIFSWLTSIGGGVSTLRDAFLGTQPGNTEGPLRLGAPVPSHV